MPDNKMPDNKMPDNKMPDDEVTECRTCIKELDTKNADRPDNFCSDHCFNRYHGDFCDPECQTCRDYGSDAT